MDLDAEYLLVREQLYQLGFQQPLPIGSLALVKSLLDDLVKTTSHLKQFNEENQQLLKEKVAWDLSVEPYKCDNSRLLAECNRLHLELLKQREEERLKVCEIRRTARNLETDNQCLEEQCEELSEQLRRAMFASGVGGGFHKRKDDKKPFVSTVRQNPASASEAKIGRSNGVTARFMKSNCTCGKEVSRMEMAKTQRLKDDVQSQGDFIVELRSQIDSRDREIVRLNSLLTGGRPTAALGKDCCYRGVGTLSEDVVVLQKQKVSLQGELAEAVAQQHEAKERAIALAEQNRELEMKLQQIEETALTIESSANKKIRSMEDEMKRLKLQDTKIGHTKATRDMENGSIQNRTALNRYKDQIDKLQAEFDRCLNHDHEMTELNEKLCMKMSRLKIKYKALLQERNNVPDKRDAAISPVLTAESRSSSSISMVKSERDYYQKEYMRLLNQSESLCELENLREQLRLRNDQLLELQRSTANVAPETSRSVQSMLNRAEREKNALQSNLERVRSEVEVLHDRWMESKEELQSERERFEAQQQEWLLQKNRLQCECNSLAAQQGVETIMQARLNSLEAINRQQADELVQAKTAYQQLKTLQSQTEKSLVQHQSMLHDAENKLGSTTSRLNSVDSCRQESLQQINELRAEMATLRALNVAAENEKDQLTSELDIKTEKLFHAEAELSQSRNTSREQQITIEKLQRKVDASFNDIQQKEGTLRQSSNEFESMRRQIDQLVRNNENTMAENRRLESEVCNYRHDHEKTKAQLTACEKEVERLKNQLQKYVQEVQKAEELLMNKEAERDEMLDQFKSLSKDAVQLEDNNQSLEQQACHARRDLEEAELKIVHLHDQLQMRESECQRFDRQVTELSRQVAVASSDLEHCMHVQQTLQADLDATKELCDRLDVEKRKVKDELGECSDIRRKLERDNEILRSELKNTKTGSKASADNIQQLLTVARLDLDQKRSEIERKNDEMDRLRKKYEDLQDKLSDTRKAAAQHETLAQEYGVQIQELRQKLTDKRFEKITVRREPSSQLPPNAETDRHQEHHSGKSHKNARASHRDTSKHDRRKRHTSGDQYHHTTDYTEEDSRLHEIPLHPVHASNLSIESTPNSLHESGRFNISETDSTEISQLNRISLHLMPGPQTEKPFNRTSFYFPRNASHSEEKAVGYRLNHVPSINLGSEISSTESINVDSGDSPGEDETMSTNKSRKLELIELADLQDRFNQQQSSEEEILAANRNIRDQTSSVQSEPPHLIQSDDHFGISKSFSEPNYQQFSKVPTYNLPVPENNPTWGDLLTVSPSMKGVVVEQTAEVAPIQDPDPTTLPTTYRLEHPPPPADSRVIAVDQPIPDPPPTSTTLVGGAGGSVQTGNIQATQSNTSVDIFHSAVWNPPNTPRKTTVTHLDQKHPDGGQHSMKRSEPITIDTSCLPPPPPFRPVAPGCNMITLRLCAQDSGFHSDVSAVCSLKHA